MLLVMAAALALAAGPSDDAPRCQRDGDVFHLSGRIDAELTACVQAHFGEDVSEVIVNSRGGEADQAILIAKRLEPANFVLRVRGQCSSGCANLFLPLATRVIIEPGSYVMLHGSLDPQLIEEEVEASRDEVISSALRENPALERSLLEANFDAATARSRGMLEELNAFTSRNGIHPGWLFYREAGDTGLGPHVAGRLQRRNPDMVLVEEPLMRSCLPHLEIEPFQADLEARFINNRDRFHPFTRAGGARSLDLVCTSADRPSLR